MDIYCKYKGLKSCNQGLEEFSGFCFLVHETGQITEGKNSNHIVNVSINTDTHVCGICCLEWRKDKSVMNFFEYCMNINTLIIDAFETLEKNNTDTS